MSLPTVCPLVCAYLCVCVQMWCILALSTPTIWALVCSSWMLRRTCCVRSRWPWTLRRWRRSWHLPRGMMSFSWRYRLKHTKLTAVFFYVVLISFLFPKRAVNRPLTHTGGQTVLYSGGALVTLHGKPSFSSDLHVTVLCCRLCGPDSSRPQWRSDGCWPRGRWARWRWWDRSLVRRWCTYREQCRRSWVEGQYWISASTACSS